MTAGTASRVELIMAGLGGMGVLVAARLLASAALNEYKYVSWMPSYAEARRGGLSECTVILSNRKIASPILDQAQTVLLLDSSQVKPFEPRVRPDGIMIVETAGMTAGPDRKDISVVPVSGLQLAMGMGGIVVNSLIHLGVFMQAVKPFSPDLILAELEGQYAGRASVLDRNKAAFTKGLELGSSLDLQRKTA